jgi:hypothetical protein
LNNTAASSKQIEDHDTKGYAGRLSDSLEEYFGNNRVFRDIEDIEGGAAFTATSTRKPRSYFDIYGSRTYRHRNAFFYEYVRV